MKTSTSVALFSLISGIAALPSLRSIYVRDCQAGHLVCQGQALFGICNLDSKAIFMSVAEGTKCVCSGSDCTIVAQDGPAQGSQGSSGPAPTSQPAAPTSQSAAPTSQPAAPSSQVPATTSQAPPATQPSSTAAAQPSAPSTGAVFKETPTVTLPATAPTASQPAPSSGSGGLDIGLGKGYLKTFLGNGAASSGWPGQSEWGSFESLWAANAANILPKSCANWQQANNSPEEIADLKSAILSVAESSGVDSRFILAVVMQESNGCVRAPTSNYGVQNPGLMQSHDGSHTCANVNPCPKDMIVGMIQDGVEGTPSGDGLKQLLAKAGGSDAETFYKAARMYNSGSIDPSGDLGKGIATHCYASDIANRLMGWSEGVGGCHIG